MGPNTVTGHHSVIYTAECAINFTIRLARLILTDHADSTEIKRTVQKRESEWIQRKLQSLVWTKEDGGSLPLVPSRLMCTGWYVDRETGRNHLIYPSFMTHYWFRTIFPKFSNFEITGARGWIGFYFGLLRGKIRRNKWILAVIVAVLGWCTTRSRSI